MWGYHGVSDDRYLQMIWGYLQMIWGYHGVALWLKKTSIWMRMSLDMWNYHELSGDVMSGSTMKQLPESRPFFNRGRACQPPCPWGGALRLEPGDLWGFHSGYPMSTNPTSQPGIIWNPWITTLPFNKYMQQEKHPKPLGAANSHVCLNHRRNKQKNVGFIGPWPVTSPEHMLLQLLTESTSRFFA